MHIVGSVSEIQRSDIWSFGCVLSLAATWLVKGLHGIQLFDRYRQPALHEGERNDYGCFHDGNKVLVEVLQWHTLLRQAILPMDQFTGPLPNLIDQRLLQSDRNQRASASDMHQCLM
jgi:hypothetical protein